MIKYKLGDVVEVISERVDNPADCEHDKFVGLEHYISGDVEITKYGETSLLKSAMKVFKSGDILIARRNVYLKRASIVKFDGITSGDSIVLRVKNELLRCIIPFVLNTDEFWGYAEKFSDGTMSKRLSPKVLLEYEFILPQLDMQEKLAELLWTANETKEAYKKLLNLTDVLVKSQFIEMIDNMNYPCVDLISLVQEGAGLSYGIVQPGEDGTGDMGVLRPVDLVDGQIVKENIKYIDRSIGDSYKRTELTGKELLISVRGTTGITALSNTNFAGMNVTRGIAVIRYNEDLVDPIYLNAYMRTDESQRYIAENTKGIALKQINLSDLRIQPILLPPRDVQSKFADFVEQTDKSKFELKQNIDNLEKTIKALMSKNFSL